MFTNDEKVEIQKMIAVFMSDNAVGRKDVRDEIAGEITDLVRDYLGKRYSSKTAKTPEDGVTRLQDTLKPKDFNR